MYVKVELKRYRNLKSTGKIVMNVRFVAYYQLMQVCQRDFKNLSDTAPFFGNFEPGGYVHGAAFTGGFTYSIPTSPNFVNPNVGDQFTRLEFEPNAKCPQNFIIFDQTDVKHRVMCNPAFVQKFSLENLDLNWPNLEAEDLSRLCNSPSFKEDTNEIDILLNSDEGEESDDDTISTGRTPGNWNSTSCNCSSCDSSYGVSDWNECKREKMRKMVKILQEIVPGGEGLDTGTVLDEAVKYLKYLKKEVKKLGISSCDCGVP
ncbi:Transcription factor bHLH144 [Carex littledalei]|uniref:Transcription factor bHLH144 n=1 Tax=Carex littledalei TaxID=544730 RepID=A0A833R0F8_9POAL|nr:Transcription factor bHLH144 [Carex littledalei]